MSVNIRFAEFPGTPNEIRVEGEKPVVLDLLKQTGKVKEGDVINEVDIRINRKKVPLDLPLQEGDLLVIFKLITGNADEDAVYIKLNGTDVIVPANSQVEDVLRIAKVAVGDDEAVFEIDSDGDAFEVELESFVYDDEQYEIRKVVVAEDEDDELDVDDDVVAANAGSEETESEEPIEVPGADPAELRIQIAGFLASAAQLDDEAAEAIRTARMLRRKADAYAAKANEIEEALDGLKGFVAKLQTLKLVRQEGQGFMTDILRLVGLKK